MTLLVDPGGWLPPASAERSNWDDPSPAPDLALTALALTAWARITLRTTAPRPAR